MSTLVFRSNSRVKHQPANSTAQDIQSSYSSNSVPTSLPVENHTREPSAEPTERSRMGSNLSIRSLKGFNSLISNFIGKRSKNIEEASKLKNLNLAKVKDGEEWTTVIKKKKNKKGSKHQNHVIKPRRRFTLLDVNPEIINSKYESLIIEKSENGLQYEESPRESRISTMSIKTSVDSKRPSLNNSSSSFKSYNVKSRLDIDSLMERVTMNEFVSEPSEI